MTFPVPLPISMDAFVANFGEAKLARLMHKHEGLNGKLPPDMRLRAPESDMKNREILAALRGSGGMGTMQIAAIVGLGKSGTYNRLQDMARSGAVFKYKDNRRDAPGRPLRRKTVWDICRGVE